MEVTDQIAIVTGAGQGIGEATAHCLAREGACVVVVDLNSSTGAATAGAIQEAGGRAHFVQADVTRADEVRAMVDAAMDAFGKIDILANVAGIQGMVADVVELPEDEWHRVLNANITSVYLRSKYCIPAMEKGGGGAIVNVASM